MQNALNVETGTIEKLMLQAMRGVRRFENITWTDAVEMIKLRITLNNSFWKTGHQKSMQDNAHFYLDNAIWFTTCSFHLSPRQTFIISSKSISLLKTEKEAIFCIIEKLLNKIVVHNLLINLKCSDICVCPHHRNANYGEAYCMEVIKKHASISERIMRNHCYSYSWCIRRYWVLFSESRILIKLNFNLNDEYLIIPQ